MVGGMNKKTLTILSLLVVAILVVFLLIYLRMKPEFSPTAAENRRTEVSSVPAIETSIVETDSSSSGEAIVGDTNAGSRYEAVSEADMTPFLRSEIAEKWQRELGYTKAEIAAAQRDIRAQRYPEETVNDPGVIMRHLPPRHTGQVAIEHVTITPQVKTGEPIPFSVTGTAPSPSFQFTHFDVLVQGEVIRVRARGNADGNTENGKGGPVTLDGTIDPLPPGAYRIEIAELGPMGSFPFTVRE